MEPDAKGMRNVPFIYYEDWVILFGKDRAIGVLAEGPADMVDALEKEDQTTEECYTPIVDLPDCSLSACGTPCNQGGSGTTSKKRAREAEGIAKGLVNMAIEFGSFFKKTNTTMEEITHRIGYAQDLSQARKLVNGELAKLRLNTNDRLRAATLIVKDAERVDLFFSLPEEEKIEWENLRCSREGLSTESAQQRLELFGHNKLEEKEETAAIMAIALANGGRAYQIASAVKILGEKLSFKDGAFMVKGYGEQGLRQMLEKKLEEDEKKREAKKNNGGEGGGGASGAVKIGGKDNDDSGDASRKNTRKMKAEITDIASDVGGIKDGIAKLDMKMDLVLYKLQIPNPPTREDGRKEMEETYARKEHFHPSTRKKPNKAKRPRQGFEQLDRFDSLPWNSSLFENDDPFSISVGSSELEGGFLSLEEIDESEYGLEIPKPERENKKQRTKENKNEKKRKHSEVEDELGGEVEAVSEEKDNKVKRKKKKKKKKKKKNKDAKNSEENEEPTAEVRYWENTLSIPRGVDHGPPSVNSPEPCSRELVRIRLYDTVNTGSVFFVVSELQEIAPGITSVFFFSSYVLQATFTDILKQLGTRQAFTPEQINEACYVDINSNKAVFDSLRNNPKVNYDGMCFAYKSKHALKDKNQLLILIRKFPEGIAVIDLKDAYPTVMEDLQMDELVHKAKLYRTN
ncbi:unnamed protein product [Camellia sinensis]